jgi:Kef-type K+ transport system membrane component KefB
MDVFSAAPHDAIAALLFQISLLLLAARACGEIAQRLNQPAVVGELLAGILLGPSALCALVPALTPWIVPQTPLSGHLIEVVGLFGAIFLLLITGLETDLRLIRRHFKTGAGVSLGAFVLPFASGYVLGLFLPDSLLVEPERRHLFAFFIATAMSISAIPVIAKVLMDLNLMRREIGQTIIAAGMCDDTLGWILLSVITGLASGKGVSAASVARSAVSMAAFLAFSFTAGRWFVKKSFGKIEASFVSANKSLSFVLVLTFAWATVTQIMKFEAVFGAFIMGILLGQAPQLTPNVHRKLRAITLGFFAPIFFALAGLKANLARLADPKLFIICVVVVGIASIGKIAGAYAGARYIGGKDRWTALSFGAGMNARGAMEIIIATIGLSSGLLSLDMFSVIVVMAMATSLMAPAMLRFTVSRIKPDEQETKRLAEEDRVKGSLIAGVRRVLIPIRYKAADEHPIHALEAQILDMLAKNAKLSLTLFSVAPAGQKERFTAFLNRVAPLFPRRELAVKVVESDRLAEAILDEADRDYDLVMLGAPEHESGDTLFTPLVDYLVRAAPCPTLVVKGAGWNERWTPAKMLVPTNGSAAAKNAAELAFALAGKDTLVVTLNAVVQGADFLWRQDGEGDMLQRELAISHQIVMELSRLGTKLGVKTTAESRMGPAPETVILNYAAETAVDMILLGTNLRPGSPRLFLGPRVERILNHAKCPVVVINSL